MKRLNELLNTKRTEVSVAASRLKTDGGTQYRDNIDQEVVYEYRDAIKRGDGLPPLLTVYDGSVYWVVDGFHRHQAHLLLGTSAIPITYIHGSKEDAQLLALTVNATHGLRRSRLTLERVVRAALENSELAALSDYELAKTVGVSPPFVAKIRDPEAKARQQAARDRSAAKRIKQEVVNPINSQEVGDPSPASEFELVSPQSLADGAIPSESELRSAELAFQADQEAMYKLLEADDALATAYEEIKRLNHLLASKEMRFHGLMAERNEAVKMVKGLQRRCDRLEAELRGHKGSKGEIRLDQELKGLASIAESLSRRPPFI